MPRTYRYGYGASIVRLTEEQLMTKWSFNMVHPEMRRRAIRLMQASQDAGSDVGIGGGGGARDPIAQLAEALRRHVAVSCGGSYDRRYNGSCYNLKSGQAPYAFPGSSNHETGILDGFALAIDFIGWEDHWFDRNCERFGIKNFGGAVGPEVNGEEWHGQPIEFSNSRSAVDNEIQSGRRLTAIALPGDLPTPTPNNYKRIAMTNGFEFASATRWDTRGFGNPIPAGQYAVKLDEAKGKVGAIINLTIVKPTGPGYASTWPSGDRPNTSKINYSANENIANEVSVPLAADGSFQVYISSPAHIVIDLTGYWLA